MRSVTIFVYTRGDDVKLVDTFSIETSMSPEMVSVRFERFVDTENYFITVV